MRRLTKKVIKEVAERLVKTYNPYIKGSIQFFIDQEARYIWKDGRVYTKDQLDDSYMDMAMKDIERGYNERGVGYYDKWYRYNHADEGRAYDEGCKLACAVIGCCETMTIIECMN